MKKIAATAILIFLKISPATTQTQLAGIINRYTKVAAVDTCTGKIEVADTTGFRAGEQMLLIQMQGAEIVQTNTSNFGNITDIRNAGRYEICQIAKVEQQAIFVKQTFVNQYDASGAVQAVTFPKFENAVVVDTILPKNWDGETGGIIALEVAENLTLNAPIWADTAGFRGGASFVAAQNDCYFLLTQNDYAYPQGTWRSASKGEGIAKIAVGREFGRGAQANGGGGGNDHNSGGGGGANVTSGGRGGDNDEPTVAGCRGNFPGVGGKKINQIAGRIYLGGGGGAGHSNNFYRSKGGNGGGIIFLLAKNVDGSNPKISANGQSARSSDGDGAGGGGAGGSILCQIENAPDDLQILANGGDGGNPDYPDDRCLGPGGGGAGGRILTNQIAVAQGAGGAAGIRKNSFNVCNETSGGATNGESGSLGFFQKLPAGTLDFVPAEIIQQPENQEVCTGNAASFTCTATGTGVNFQWEKFENGQWKKLTDGGAIAGATTPILKIDPTNLTMDGSIFRCLAAGVCFALPTDSVLLEVSTSPTANFSFSVGQNGLVSFQNLAVGADNLTWFFGDGTSSTEANPTHQFSETGSFTVTLQAVNNCGAAVVQQQVAVVFVSAGEVFDEKLMQIFPNPAGEWLFVKIENLKFEPSLAQVFDSAGRLVFEKTVAGFEFRLPTDGLAGGEYFLFLKSAAGSVSRRFLK